MHRIKTAPVRLVPRTWRKHARPLQAPRPVRVPFLNDHLNISNPTQNDKTLTYPKATALASLSPTPRARPRASLALNSPHRTTTTFRSSASPASATTKATVWIRVSSPGMTSTLSSRCCGLCQRLRTARVGRVWFVLGRRGWRGGVGCQVRIRVGRGSWR